MVPMAEHEWAAEYEDAIKRLQRWVERTSEGTFRLTIKDGRAAGIDQAVFEDLKRALDMTNVLIRRKEIDPNSVSRYE
jgi:hypothetical protein